MQRILLWVVIHVFINPVMYSQTVIPLYQKVPNSIASADKEKSVVTDGLTRISHVSVPTLTVYKPAVQNGKKAAVIICPGGGYVRLAFTHEGTDVANAFAEWGLVAFVLKYRLPDDTIMVDKSIGPLQDAQRALQVVRERAAEWNIDPTKIGMMGFSAGGHLAATASTHFTQEVIDNPARTSLRPDFSILIYPVISFADSLMHAGSRTSLIGKNPSAEKILLYSNERQVNAQSPPAFLVHTGDDKTVKVANSIRYYEALQGAGVPAELHLYPGGGHGFGMNNKTTSDKWMERLNNWLAGNNLL